MTPTEFQQRTDALRQEHQRRVTEICVVRDRELRAEAERNADAVRKLQAEYMQEQSS